MKKKLLSILKILFFLGIGIFLIWWIVKGLTEEEIVEIKRAFREANYWWVALSVLIGVGAHVSRAHRWNMLIHPLGYEPKLKNTFAAVMIGYLANYAFPRLGEITRCGIMYRYEKVPVNKGIGTVIAERAIDMVMLVILFIVTMILQFYRFRDIIAEGVAQQQARFTTMVYGENSVLYIGAGVLFLILLLLLYVFRRRFRGLTLYDRIVSIIKGFVDGIKSVKDIKDFKPFLLHTAIIWIAYFLMIYVCFFCLEETAGLGVYASLAVLVFGSLGIIAVQGGIGAYQAIVMGILVLYGVEASIGFAFGWIIWGGQTILNIGLGAIFLILLPIMNTKPAVDEEVGNSTV